jgi:hypothetical protein
MATQSKMSLLSVIEEEERLWSSQLQSDREDALERYRGKPYGDEQEGLSQVVSHDVADVINWMMPQLVKLFLAGDTIVSFSPMGPEDVDAAEQESEYLNHVLLEKHSGAFETIYAWILDGLTQKNGYVKAWWDESEDVKEEEYEGLSPEEMQMLAADPTFEITSVEPDPEEQTIEIKGKRRKQYGCVQYAGIPPEQVIVSSRACKVRPGDADFTEHWEYKSISQLRAEGYEVDDDIGDEANTYDQESVFRDRYNWQDENDRPAELRRVKVREIWLNFDEDGDGIAELRHVVVIGTTILENEPADVVPVAAWTPYIEAHQHIGQSIADQIMDLQRIKTSLTRVMIDGLYIQTHGRWAVTDRVNLDDMLISRPNGIVRVDGTIADALMPMAQQPTSPIAINGIQYIDSVKYERTGMNPASVGVDQNALNPTNTATGIISLQNAAQERVLLIARAFAEMGLRDLFSIAHALTLKHARQQDIVRLRGQWVPVDPRQWRERKDLIINVGLGTGNKEQQLMQLNAILQYQMQLLPLGITNPENIYNAMRKLIHNAGFKAPEEFLTDPKLTPPAPPPPDPKVQIEMAKLQDGQQRTQAEMVLSQRELQAKQQSEAQKMQVEAMLEEQRIALERYKAELDAQTKKELAVMQMAADSELEQARMSHSTQLESQKLKLSHQYKVRENNKTIQDENYDADAEEQLARAKMEVLANIMNEIRGLSRDIDASRPEAIMPVRDARGRVVGGRIRTAGGEVRDIQIQ